MKGLGGYYSPNPSEVINMWIRYGSIPLVLSLFSLIQRKNIPILAFIAISFIVILTGPKSDYSRYSVHLLPIFYAFSAVALYNFYRTSSSFFKKSLLLFLFMAAAGQSIQGERFGVARMLELAPHQICRKQIGQYIEKNIPIDAYVASGDIGAIAYEAINHRFVDIAGLTSKDVLEEYAAGRTANAVFIEKDVRYLANTFAKNHQDSSYYISHPAGPSESEFYNKSITDVMFTCSYGDYDFKLVKIKPLVN